MILLDLRMHGAGVDHCRSLNELAKAATPSVARIALVQPPRCVEAFVAWLTNTATRLRGQTLPACKMIPCTLRSLRGFHLLGVFAEARFAVAPGAVMERLLCLRHVRLIAFPGFEHWSL
jgi:hypothetical protein